LFLFLPELLKSVFKETTTNGNIFQNKPLTKGAITTDCTLKTPVSIKAMIGVRGLPLLPDIVVKADYFSPG
jgi:hypothetical protein